MTVSTYSTRESAAPMFTYDAIGNPTNILGVEMGWNGRQLTELTAPEDSYASHVTYAYNTDGQRVSKTVTLAEDQSTQTTEYFYNGEILAGQKTGEDILVFMYDNNGDYFGFTVNGTPYYYVKNAQNDVIAVTDANGTILLRYHYNAWGEVWIESFFENDAEATEEAYLNPITYRSYYLDFETAFYYLNTRYYIPMFCRFLNADGITDGAAKQVGKNLFVYAANNPINNSDTSGKGIFKNTVKWFVEKVAMPVTNSVRSRLLKYNRTYSKGLCFNLSTGLFNYSGQIGVSVDTKGNVAVQGTFATGLTAGTKGISGGVYRSKTNAPSINKLTGFGVQIGGSAGAFVYGVPISGGTEFNIIPDELEGQNYYGITKIVGFGTPGIEGHVEMGDTANIGYQVNVFDSLDSMYIKIMEWE